MEIEYNEDVIRKFRKYLKILYEYKAKLHLLSHGDYNCISRRHFLISLMAINYIKNCGDACDIGAGAGFPSIPLKILRPGISFTLFESRGKKAEFLKHLIRELELSGVAIIDQRAEYYNEKKFDLILLKAAGKIKKLIRTIDNLIASDGKAIFYKSHRVEDELKAAQKELKKRGFQIQTEKLFTPVGNSPLALVILKK